MWISERSKSGAAAAHSARMGVVTAQGAQTGVYTDAERRCLPVLAPGGYRWRPGNGAQVLVLKTGADGESACILAQQTEQADELQPGEVELAAVGCAVRLTGDGAVELQGTVKVNGMTLEDIIQTMVVQALGAATQEE